MSKRTSGKYERRERDFYATPESPVLRLVPFLKDVDTFSEPMCGDGAIVDVLEALGWPCVAAMDMEPQGGMVGRAQVGDVLSWGEEDFEGADEIISNPPWPMPPNRKPKGEPDGWPTVPIIHHLMLLRPTWLLLAADFMHNVYFRDLEPHCDRIVSVGRVKWIAGTTNTGFDNAAWYHFDANHLTGPKFSAQRPPLKTYHPDIEDLL